jgi:hypothetical protein
MMRDGAFGEKEELLARLIALTRLLQFEKLEIC